MHYTFPPYNLIFTAKEPAPRLAQAKTLCEFYRANSTYPESIGEIWHTLFVGFLKPLHDALLEGDAEKVLAVLDNASPSTLLTGMDLDFTTYQLNGALQQQFDDDLVCAGNAVGSLPVFNTEQPLTDSHRDYEAVISDLEKKLGFPLDDKGPGRVKGANIGGRFITHRTLYGIPAMHLVTSLAPWAETICEIGGGVGFLANLILTRQRDITYAIVDLPVVSVIQAYFLGVELGEDRVVLHPQPLQSGKVKICGLNRPEVEDGFDVIINQNSMPEMPRDIALDYLHWIKHRLNPYQGLFISINQESSLGGQTPVADLVKEVGDFQRSVRLPYWPRPLHDRSNYIVEVFMLR